MAVRVRLVGDVGLSASQDGLVRVAAFSRGPLDAQLAAVLGGVIAWFSIHLIRTNSDIEAMALPISVAWMYVPMLPAGLVTMGQALHDLWQQLSGRGQRSKVVTP